MGDKPTISFLVKGIPKQILDCAVEWESEKLEENARFTYKGIILKAILTYFGKWGYTRFDLKDFKVEYAPKEEVED